MRHLIDSMWTCRAAATIEAKCDADVAAAVNADECLPGDTNVHLNSDCLSAYAQALRVQASLAVTATTNFNTIHTACTNTTTQVRHNVCADLHQTRLRRHSRASSERHLVGCVRSGVSAHDGLQKADTRS